MAAEHGATYAGLVMVPNTPRALTRRQAAEIAAAARIPTVGVFRNEKLMEVALAAHDLGLAAVQLHGEEDAGYVRGLRSLLPEETEIWSVGAVGRDLPATVPGADRTLFDTKVNGRSGGTGIPFDWSRVAGRSDLASAILAGGLRPENAGKASRLGTFALDVSSGVEMAPGRKDSARMQALFEALRLPVRGEASPC
jgi:indole-3-glycerol phosphate synthase/phosphoribosylanthranilate isomerase